MEKDLSETEKTSLIFFDTETTGLHKPRLLQLGMAIGMGEPTVELFKPPVAIEEKAKAIHGISEEDVALRRPFAEARERIQNLFDGAIAIAHNLEFDKRVMANEGVEIKDGICTLKIARNTFGKRFKSYKLSNLCKQLGLPELPAHSAYWDVKMLQNLFQRIVMEKVLKGLPQGTLVKNMVDYCNK